MPYFRWKRKLLLLSTAAMLFTVFIQMKIHDSSGLQGNNSLSEIERFLKTISITTPRRITGKKRVKASDFVTANDRAKMHGVLRRFTTAYDNDRTVAHTDQITKVSETRHDSNNGKGNSLNSEKFGAREIAIQSETLSSHIQPKQKTMTVKIKGRLGNNIFQLGALIGISSYHGYQPHFPTTHNLRSIFQINLPVALPARNTSLFKEMHPGTFDPEVLRLRHDVNWTLVGFYQSWKYFLNSSSEVRAQLRFKPRIQRVAERSLPPFVFNRTTVGVHVRRGDMKDKHQLERGYAIADESYLRTAMQYYRDKYRDVVFVVCSDDIDWCRGKLSSNDTVFVHVTAEVDLAVLAGCTHSIITTGTFGWWGAFLAGGETVYYKNYPRKHSWLGDQYAYEDYYLPHWRGFT